MTKPKPSASLRGRRPVRNMMSAPNSVGVMDPEHTVPATISEVRKWLERIDKSGCEFEDDAELLKAANFVRSQHCLPAFTVVTYIQRDMDQRELGNHDLDNLK